MDKEKEVLDFLTRQPLNKQLELWEKTLESMTGLKYSLREVLNPKTDRDILECIQETYSVIFCIENRLDYKTFDVRRYLDKDKYFSWIADYKVEHFSSEILQELGIELLRKTEKGFIVRDKMIKERLN